MLNNNKNITLRIKGGIGNQLFIFSFLIYLQKKYKLNIYIDFKSGYQSLLGGKKFKQKFLLNKLNYFFLYQKDKYLDIIKEYEEQVNNGTLDKVNKALENMEL